MKEVMVHSPVSLRGTMRVVSGAMLVRCRTSYTKIFKDSINNFLGNFSPSIKIYPNPVIKGTAFTIALTVKQTGIYTIQVADAAGRLMEERKINVPAKQYSQQLQSGNWSAGIYYIRVMDDKGKVQGTGSLVVQ